MTADFRLAIKTGIAGALAMFISKFLRLPEGYWAAISAVIVMQSNLGAALRDSWVRIAATAIGAAVSIPFMVFWGPNLLAFGIAVTTTVLLCSILNLQPGTRLASATVGIVMLINRVERPWILAAHRFLGVSLGIVVALLVSHFIWPSRAIEKLENGLGEAFRKLHSLFKAVIDRYRGKQSAAITNLMEELQALERQNEEFQSQGKYELALRPGNQRALDPLTKQEDQILHAIAALEIAARENTGDTYYKLFDPEFENLTAQISDALNLLAEGIAMQQIRSSINLNEAVVALDARAQKLREARSSFQYALEEILRWHTIYLVLKDLARELNDAQRFALELSPAKKPRS